jgi:hypothetical protein
MTSLLTKLRSLASELDRAQRAMLDVRVGTTSSRKPRS